MRNKKNVKIIAIALLCTLVIGAAIGIGVSADDATGKKVASIGKINLAYNAELNLAVELTQGDAYEGDLGLGVWPAGTKVENMTEDNDIFINYTVEKGTAVYHDDNDVPVTEDIYYAFSQGIAAKDIKTKYAFAAVVKTADGTLLIGEVMECSVEGYIELRLNTEGVTVTDKQEALYEAVLAYGDAANELLNKAE